MYQMKRMLRCIQDEYEYPVDTEFTINISDNGEYSVNLLRCRPLQIQKTSSGTIIPEDIDKERILLESKGASMGISKTSELDLIVYVDPVNYYIQKCYGDEGVDKGFKISTHLLTVLTKNDINKNVRMERRLSHEYK